MKCAINKHLTTFSLFLVLLMWCNISNAEDALASGGKSPDGRYEVRILKDDSRDPSNYSYRVVDTSNEKLVKKLDETGGFCEYEGAIQTSKVLWNSSSTLFGLTDHGTRHSMDLYIFNVQRSGVSEIKIPDYTKEGLSLVGATECYGTSVVTLKEWNGDALTCAFAFDAEINGSRSPLYKTTFTATVKLSKKGSAQITSMDKPVPEE